MFVADQRCESRRFPMDLYGTVVRDAASSGRIYVRISSRNNMEMTLPVLVAKHLVKSLAESRLSGVASTCTRLYIQSFSALWE